MDSNTDQHQQDISRTHQVKYKHGSNSQVQDEARTEEYKQPRRDDEVDNMLTMNVP